MKRSKKNNGINYLENTPEAEVPSDYYMVENSGNPNVISKDKGYGKFFILIIFRS